MRARHFVLLLVVLGLAACGCGQSNPPSAEIAEKQAQDNAAPKGELIVEEDVIVIDDVPGEKTGEMPDQTDAAAEDDVGRTPGEPAVEALPDDAHDLIALIQRANEQRRAHGADNSRHNYLLSHEHQAAVARVLAAGKKLREIATAEDRKLDGYDEAIGVWLLYRTGLARPGDFDSLHADLNAYFAAGPAPTAAAAEAAVRATQRIVFSDDARALTLCRQCGPILSKSDDAKVRSYGAKLEGIARGLDLPGHTLEIKGTTVEGKPFDLTELRGKIVLVDFFTTWCGPCRAELPNVRSKYERYHDRGFEVVTISLDDDRDALNDFLKAEPVPWTMLYDGPWSDNPSAIYYGVSGVPDLILIDKQGKVVSHGWEGDKWRAKLAELLGVDAKDESASDAGTTAPDKASSDADTGKSQ